MLFKIVNGTEIHVLSKIEPLTLYELQEFIKKCFKVLPRKFILIYRDQDENAISIVSDQDLQVLQDSGIHKVRILIQDIQEKFYDQTQVKHIQEMPKEEENYKITFQEEKTAENLTEKGQHHDIKSLENTISEKIGLMLPEIVQKIKNQFIEENSTEKMCKQSLETPNCSPPSIFHGTHCMKCGADPITSILYKCVTCYEYELCQNCEISFIHEHPLIKIRDPKHSKLTFTCSLNDEVKDPKRGSQLLKSFYERVKQNVRRQEEAEKESREKEEKEFQSQIQTNTIDFKENAQDRDTEHDNCLIKVFENEQKTEPTSVLFFENKLDVANYLSDTLEIDFKLALEYVQKFPNLDREEIVSSYCNQL